MPFPKKRIYRVGMGIGSFVIAMALYAEVSGLSPLCNWDGLNVNKIIA
jgi:hypothetical protein